MGALAGVAAGTGGALLLRRVPRAVTVSASACAVLVGVLWGALVAVAPGWPLWWWPIPLVLSWAGVVLGAADLASRRLPDALTLPGVAVASVLVVVAAARAGDPDLAARALGGALLWAGGYAAVRLVSASALGGGDVKLAVGLGALTAACSWSALLLAVLLANVLTAVVALAARLLGHRAVPHGPAMLLAAWLMVLRAPL